LPKKAVNVKGLIQRIIDYQAWIADGKLGDEAHRVNPLLNDCREALGYLRRKPHRLQRQVKSLQTRITNLEKMNKDHEDTIADLNDQLVKKRG